MGAMTEQYKQINDLLDQAEALMVETGMYDVQTARAMFYGIRPASATDNIVGNVADLQRQPLMPPGFEQGAMDGANPVTQVAPGSSAPVTARTSREKMEEAGVVLPESPATSDEAIERMSQDPTPTTTVVDGGQTADTSQTTDTSQTAETSQSDGDLSGMTKEQLQAHADSSGISGVNQNTQTKEEMLQAIQGNGG